jgi:hypothetical protein
MSAYRSSDGSRFSFSADRYTLLPSSEALALTSALGLDRIGESQRIERTGTFVEHVHRERGQARLAAGSAAAPR